MPRLKRLKEQPITHRLFRSDTPPTDLEEGRDAFGHKAYGEALASALGEAQAPFTFGLFGPFGLGKTTVIDEVRRQVKATGTAVLVTFDAWRYEGDALRRHFLREVVAALVEEGELDRSWSSDHLQELDASVTVEERTGRIRLNQEQLIQAVVRIIPAALLIWLAWRFAPTLSSGSTVEATRFIAAALIAAATYFVTDFSKVLYVPTQEVTADELKPELFAHKFSDIIADLKKSRRLIVAIDNLDRCSADRIEEVFFTLSTFLEPVSRPHHKKRIAIGKDRTSGKDAVFLIAADDVALRKHLDAKEWLATRGAEPRLADREDTGSYADEYLRKIFKATISMKQILADDMREFVDAELADFAEERELDQQQRATLVELVSAALKSNPRRIREFGNNLELQLRLIEAREWNGQINPKISPDVLLVAKTRLLEEEWPRSYQEIYADPRLLAQWYERAAAGDEVPAPDAEDPRFVAFLNIARTVTDRNLRALLRLKQSADEVSLPRSVEFHEALVEGDRGTVEEIVTADGADAGAYARRLSSIASEEIKRHYISGSRNLVETALSVEALRSQGEGIRRLLMTVTNSPPARNELRQMLPDLLVPAAADLLDQGNLNQLLDPWVSLQTFFAEGPGNAARVVSELAPILDKLDSRRRSRLQESLEDEDLKASVETYLPLAEADPSLVPAKIVTEAVERLGTPIDTSSAEFRLFRACLPRSPKLPIEPQTRFKDLVVQELAANSQPHVAAFGLTAEHLNDLAAAVEVMTEASDPETLQTACQTALAPALAASQEQADALMDLSNEALRWSKATGAEEVATALATTYRNHNTEQFLAYAESRAPSLERLLRRAVIAQLQTIAEAPSIDADLRLRAAAAIANIDQSKDKGAIATTISTALDNGEWPFAQQLAEQHPEPATGHREDIIGHAVDRVEDEPAISAEAVAFFAPQIAHLSDEQRERLAAALGADVAKVDEAPTRSALEAADRFAEGSDDFDRVRQSLVRQLFDLIAPTPLPPPFAPALVSSRAEALDQDRRSSLIAQLERWIVQPGAHQVVVAEAAAELENPAQDELNKLLDAVINAETAAVGDPQSRSALLRVASRLRGRGGSKADKRFLARIAVLREEESEENTQIIEQLEADETI